MMETRMYSKKTTQVFWFFSHVMLLFLPAVPSILYGQWLQVEQLENQLRAKSGVAPKPGSGGAGESKIVVEGDEMKISLHGSATEKKKSAGPIGTLTGAGDEGAKHTGDGRAGAGKSGGNDMLNNALWQQFWNDGLGNRW